MKNLIVGPRCSGRTTTLIKKCWENGGVYVARNRHHAEVIERFSAENNTPVDAVSFHDLLVNRPQTLAKIRCRSIYIDDIEDLFADNLLVDIGGVSAIDPNVSFTKKNNLWQRIKLKIKRGVK